MQAQAEDIAQTLSEVLGDIGSSTRELTPSVNIDQENVGKGLAQLVLTLVRLVHDLLERQALRRMDAGSLTDEEVDRLGRTLQAQAREIEDMAQRFGLSTKDLNLDLGPLGKAL